MRTKVIICIAAMGLALAGCGTSTDTAGDSTPPEQTSQTPTEKPTEKPSKTPAPTKENASTIPGDGTFVVGTDIKAGTYKTAGPADSAIPNCYWARLKGTSGAFEDILANGNTGGPATVTIRSGDAAFETSGCETWQKVG